MLKKICFHFCVCCMRVFALVSVCVCVFSIKCKYRPFLILMSVCPIRDRFHRNKYTDNTIDDRFSFALRNWTFSKTFANRFSCFVSLTLDHPYFSIQLYIFYGNILAASDMIYLSFSSLHSSNTRTHKRQMTKQFSKWMW